jgi:hypothetical protein
MSSQNVDKNENLEKVFYNILEEGYKSDSNYDYLVLFSGGKDSTYLAHKLKQAKGGRVCLFTIENGLPASSKINRDKGKGENQGLFTMLEEKSLVESAKTVAAQLDMDLYIYQPPVSEFVKFYNFLITEDGVRDFDSNPLCFFCGRYIMALGLEFAERNNIPFVCYGATPMQVSGGTISRTLREVQIFDMVSRKMLGEMYKKMQKIKRYQEDPVIKKIVDKVFTHHKNTKLMFPFQYLEYNIDKLKKVLEDEYNWKNPTEGLSNEDYLTSGCPMVNLFGLLSMKRNFGIHEMNQFDSDYSEGRMTKETYEYNRKVFDDLMKGEVDPRMEEIARIIGVEDILLP